MGKKSRKSHGSSAGLVLALIAISLVIALWQWIVLGIVLWTLFRVLWKIHLRKEAGGLPQQPKLRPAQSAPCRTPPVPGRALAPAASKPHPKPARELPAPDYLPRWTTNRRFYADREHHDWQKQFDSMV